MRLWFAIFVACGLMLSILYDIQVGDISLKGSERYTMEGDPLIFWGFAAFRLILAIVIVLRTLYEQRANADLD